MTKTDRILSLAEEGVAPLYIARAAECSKDYVRRVLWRARNREREADRQVTYRTRASETALALFRSGLDTVDIAIELRVTEAKAVRLIEEAKARQKRIRETSGLHS